jgi:oligoribonuclease NrnB/cAMP/cGMP phosphodiesterase (DHH superfamily)
MDIVYHLSHIDLDGYGCQYLSRQYFADIRCYNANYGPEIAARLEEIFSHISAFRNSGNGGKILILVTDLNLSAKECNRLEKEALAAGAKIQLLDHHGTGAPASEKFAWYHLDTSRSATKITYEWLRKNFGFDQEKRNEKIVDAINAIDIWLEKDPWFAYGKVLLGMISGAREINRILFPREDRDYKLELIDKARMILDRYSREETPIILDDLLHANKKSFFRKGKNDTKDNLVAEYVTRLLNREKKRMTITYKGYKGLLGYNIGNTSLIGNAFLVSNPEYDFYMDVNSRGHFSLRSNNKIDVSLMAAEIGNGGGHPNASGGKIENYRDSFVYENLKVFIQDYINAKTAG